MLPAFPNVTTQIESHHTDVDLDDLKSSVLSNKLVISKWIQTTEKQLKSEIKKTKSKILTESKRELNYVDEILKEKLNIVTKPKNKIKLANQIRNNKTFEQADDKLKDTNLLSLCDEQTSLNNNKGQTSVLLTSNQQFSNASTINHDDQHTDVCKKQQETAFVQQSHKFTLNGSELSPTNVKENEQTDTPQVINTPKPKRKYAKNNTNLTSTNENKSRKSRKKKEEKQSSVHYESITNGVISSIDVLNNGNLQQVNTLNLIDNSHQQPSRIHQTLTTNEDFNQITKPFAPTFTNTVIQQNYSSSNDLNENHYVDTFEPVTIVESGHLIDHHYAPCISSDLNANSSDQLGNLNQLSNLNHSEDSLVAIVNNNDDLTSIPFEESELSEMLGKIGKIPEDVFNDLFMDNLTTESSELRAIENVAFSTSINEDINRFEPSISMNFKNNLNGYFTSAPSDHSQLSGDTNALIYTTSSNGTLNNGASLICTDLTQPTDHYIAKPLNNQSTSQNHLNQQFNSEFSHHPSTIDENGSYGTSSFDALDYKSVVQHSPSYSSAPSSTIHHQAYTRTNGYIGHSYPPSTVTGTIFTNNNNNNTNNNATNTNINNGLIIDGANGDGDLFSTNAVNITSNNLSTTSNITYLDCSSSSVIRKNEVDKSSFNFFSNCKVKQPSYSSSNTYSNIYDDLPSTTFEVPSTNRVPNGTSALPSFPSFSIMRKNRIESR